MKNGNGVVPRIDRAGDLWADEHRTCVSREHMMSDIDGMFGAIWFERDTSDQTWFEYCYAGNEYRIIALLERKRRIPEKGAPGRDQYERQRSALCYLARAVGLYQQVMPRVLYVVDLKGGHSEWRVERINPETEASTGEKWRIERGSSWEKVWDAAGLTDVRIALKDVARGR